MTSTEHEQIKAERKAWERQVAAVREFYGDQAAALVENGWTVDSAINHVTGNCDRLVCTGNHADAR